MGQKSTLFNLSLKENFCYVKIEGNKLFMGPKSTLFNFFLNIFIIYVVFL